MLFVLVWADWLLFPPVNLGSALVATISTGEIMRGVLGVNFTGERSLRSPVNFGSALVATISTGEFRRGVLRRALLWSRARVGGFRL